MGEPHPTVHERTDTNGSLLFPGIPPVRYTLPVRHDSLEASASVKVTVEAKKLRPPQ